MDAVEAVKSRLSIEDVISEYVELKRAGRNFRGLSPFHGEKTPSFMVSPEKQIWHDFSSNKGGNMFSFVMEMEGVDFKEALEILAKKAGVDLDQYRPKKGKPSGPAKDRLIAALDAATKFYQVQLSANREALSYALGSRKLSKQTLLDWRLGYAPNNGRALGDYLRKRGFSEAELIGAGLIGRGRGGDMFRGRLTIPLADPQGVIIGFTARLIDSNSQGPKYLNTPQTLLYDKSRHIFGLHAAKQAIRSSGYAVIAEGNLDVISSHQAGIAQTVATAGTALTEMHLKGISRFAEDIRLCFDQDKAGLAATERAVLIASKLHLSLNIINLSGGKDPDELIQKDPDLWRQAISQYSYALDWLIDRQQQLNDVNSAEGKRHFTDAMLPVVRLLEDPVERDHYLNRLAEIVSVSREALEAKARSAKKIEPVALKAHKAVELPPKDLLELNKTEDHLLCLCVARLSLRKVLSRIEPTMISRESARQLLILLKEQPQLTAAETIPLLSDGEYVKIAVLQYEELYQGLEPQELAYEANRLAIRLVAQYVKQEKQKLAQLMASSANDAATDELLTQARELDVLLKGVKVGDIDG